MTTEETIVTTLEPSNKLPLNGNQKKLNRKP